MEYAVSDKTGRNGCEGMNPPVPAYNCFDGLSPLGTGLAVGVAVAIYVILRRNSLRRFFFLLIFIVLLLAGMRYHRAVGRMVFTMPYRDKILTYAVDRQLDPNLVAAVIYVESGFKPDVISKKGARGLMQVMPETADWVAQQIGAPKVTLENLMEEETNIKLGTWYLRYLLDQFNQDLVQTLAAYNAGLNRIKEWQGSGTWNGRLSGLQQIPYPETRVYVAKVLRMYKVYGYLYQ